MGHAYSSPCHIAVLINVLLFLFFLLFFCKDYCPQTVDAKIMKIVLKDGKLIYVLNILL